MFGIELTLLQKLEIAIVLIVLGVATVFIVKSMQPEKDSSINVSGFTKQHPVADTPKHTAPVSATNPADPKKDENVLLISIADGRLLISQFPKDPSRHLAFKWEPDTHHPGQAFQYYRNPLNGIDNYSNPFKKALAFATYKKVYEVPGGLGLLGSANMSDTQAQQEKQARSVMDAEIALKQLGVEDGSFQPALLEQVVKALKAYDALPGSPMKDKAKAAAAWALLQAATKYLDANQDEQDKAIDGYVTALDKLLSSDQKQKVVAAYEQYLQRNPSAARGRTTPGATPTGRTNTTPRGSVTPTPGR
jgi:hypothetical protein